LLLFDRVFSEIVEEILTDILQFF